MEREKLSNRIRVLANTQRLKDCSEKKRSSYEKYASIVEKTLKEPKFQHYIHRIAKKENMAIDRITDIQVRTFPFKKENGNRLIGKSNTKGVICLYPKGLSFYQEQKKKCGEDAVNFYIKCRARAALIHEVLHLKYLDKEDKVQELTRKYFDAFIQLNLIGISNPLVKNLFKNRGLGTGAAARNCT